MGHIFGIIEWRFASHERRVLSVIQWANVMRLSEIIPRDYLKELWLKIPDLHPTLIPQVIPHSKANFYYSPAC
jgi:hypothetical protein